MQFHPRRSPGLPVGWGLVSIALLQALLLLLRMRSLPISLERVSGVVLFVLLVGLALLFTVWTLGLWTMRYTVDRNRLSIHWLGTRHDIPLANIEGIAPAPPHLRTLVVRGIQWWGYQVGQWQRPGLQPVLCYAAARSPRDLLLVETAGRTYGLSVPEQERFLQEVEWRRSLGALQEPPAGIAAGPLGMLGLWKDPLLWGLLALVALLNVGLFSYIAYLFPEIPRSLPLHFNIYGNPDRIALKEALFDYPWTALGLAVANSALAFLLHLREPMAAYLCLATAILLQLILWAAMVQILA